MGADILDPIYWRTRLERSRETQPHHAVFLCTGARWKAIEQRHRQILDDLFGDSSLSILDCGCGWGRLLSLLPISWQGDYLGLDISPDFIAMAEHNYPLREFEERNLLDPPKPSIVKDPYDWAVLVSIRPMVNNHLGVGAWIKIEANVRRMAKKLLYLEYDEHDKGSME